MTSERLADLLSGLRTLSDGKQVRFTPEQIWAAASMAQVEILSECRLLEAEAVLILRSGVSRYQYLPMPITGIGRTNPTDDFTATVASHNLATGDSVVVGGEVAYGGAISLEYTVTVVSATQLTLVGSSSSGTAILAGHTIYHKLGALVRFKPKGIVKTAVASGVLTGYLEGKSKQELATMRKHFVADAVTTVDEPAVLYYAESEEEPMSFEILGTPNENITTRAHYYRRPLPFEDVSETVDPIIPGIYDKLLVAGSLAWAFETFMNIPDEESTYRKKFEVLKNVAKATSFSRQVTAQTDIGQVLW